MAKGLEWLLSFNDKITGAARTILESAVELDSKFAALTGTLAGVDTAIDRTAAKFKTLGEEYDALKKTLAGEGSTGAFSAAFDREQKRIHDEGGTDANAVLDAQARLRAEARAANDAFAKSYRGRALGLDLTAERKSVETPFARLVQSLGTSSPAAAQGLMTVGRGLVDVDEGLQAIGLSLEGVATGFAAAGVAAAAFVAVGATALVLGGSKLVLGAAAFKEDSIAAFKLLLKNDSLAQGAYQQALRTADLLGANRRDTLTSFQQLMAKGFDLTTITNITKAMADLKAINPTANIQSLNLAIGQIKGKGRLQGEELMQLAEAGLSQASVMEALAEATGKSVGDVDKALRAGKIDAKQGIDAILASVQKLTGKPLGEAAIEKANSLSGLLEQLSWENVKDRLLLDVDLGPGFEVVRGALKNLNVILNDSTAAGKRLRDSIGKAFGGLFTSVFGDFSGPDGAQLIEKTILRIVGVLESVLAGVTGFFSGFGGALADGLGLGAKAFDEMSPEERAKALEKITEQAKLLGQGLGYLIVAGAAVVGMFVDLGEAVWFAMELVFSPFTALSGLLDSMVPSLSAKGAGIGKSILDGITGGLYTGIPLAVDAILSAGSALVGALKGLLGIHSPSAVFERLGGFVNEGFAVGVANDNGPASAVSAMLESPAAMAQQAQQVGASIGGSAANGSRTYNIVINAPSGEARAIRREVADLLDELEASAA